MGMQPKTHNQKDKGVRIRSTQLSHKGVLMGTVDLWGTDRPALRELAENVLLDIVRTDDEATYDLLRDLLDNLPKKGPFQL